jgi:hypothetical protein
MSARPTRARDIGSVRYSFALLLGFTLSMIGYSAMAPIAASALDQYQWHSRILLLFSDTATEAALARQHQLLREAADGVLDRDMVVVTAAEGAVQVDSIERLDLNAELLREFYGVPPHGFHALLIGKDGGVKLRSEQPIATAPLFALIDAMPMRRREMASRKTR